MIKEYKQFFSDVNKAVRNGIRFANLLKSQEDNNDAPAAIAQVEQEWEGALAGFSREVHHKLSVALYRAMRATIPVMDVIPLRWIGLIGDLKVEVHDNDRAQEFIDDVYENIKVNDFDTGWPAYQYQLVNAGLGDGMALGEAIPLETLKGFNSLRNYDSKKLSFIKTDEGLILGQRLKGQFIPIAFSDDQWIHYYAPDKRDGHPQGYPIFYGMSFVAQILERLMKSVDNSAWRVGDPSFMATVIGPEGNTDSGKIKTVINAIGSQFETIMKARRRGKVGDLFAGLPDGGSIKIDMIGAGSEKIVASIKVPIDIILDQIIAKAMLPHWMLGQRRSQGMNSNLSDAERDVINSQVKIYRRPLESIARRFFRQALVMGGFQNVDFDIEWDGVTLTDEKLVSEANLNNANAFKSQVETLLLLVESGMIQDEEEINRLAQELGITQKSLTKPEIYTILQKAAGKRIMDGG